MKRSGLAIFFMLVVWFPLSPLFGEPKKPLIPKECRDRFESKKINKSDDCSMACATLRVDMGTFDCGRFCDDYCKSIEKQVFDFGFQLSKLYPGLTDAEREFVNVNPQRAAQAYYLSWKAESICKKVYFVSDTNDESDACRHFIWASLLNAEYGQTIASELLDAHEQNPDEPENERSMDLANNRRGIIASSELIKNKTASDSQFLSQFQKDLKDGKIIVLKRRRK